MRRSLLAISLLALASCGSDGGKDAGDISVTPPSTPTPSPVPTSTPTPTPPPSPAPAGVARFDQLTGTTTLEAASGGFSGLFSSGGGLPHGRGVTAFGEATPYRYNPQARTISTVRPANLTETTFVASDIDATAPAGTVRYAKADGEQLILTQPAPGGAGLLWTRFIEHSWIVSGGKDRVIAITGVPTPISQIPTSGSATFTRTLVVGDAYVVDNLARQVTAYDLSASTISASIDYSTRRITFSLDLIGRTAGNSASIPLVTITGTTDFDGDSPSVTAVSQTFTTTAGFEIAAALFGTSGAEAGGVFEYVGTGGSRILYLTGRLAAAK